MKDKTVITDTLFIQEKESGEIVLRLNATGKKETDTFSILFEDELPVPKRYIWLDVSKSLVRLVTSEVWRTAEGAWEDLKQYGKEDCPKVQNIQEDTKTLEVIDPDTQELTTLTVREILVDIN